MGVAAGTKIHFLKKLSLKHNTEAVFTSKLNTSFYRDEIERMFENKDKDLDGRLSFEEFMGEESRAERLFKLMDKDNDGWVTKHVSRQ